MMDIIKHYLIFAIMFVSANSCFAQTKNFSFTDEGPITIGKTLSFHSEILGEDREILVSLPNDYQTSKKRYPVIYILDAQYFFEFQYAYGLINALTFMDDIPKVILVGVANKDRTKDLTPLTSTNKGNADNFVKFIKNELQVLIEEQYRTEPYKVLIGHSAGGLFALHTLLHEPDTFNAYIAISPAIWFDDGKFMDDFKAVLNKGSRFSNNLYTSLSSEGGRERKIYDEFIEIVTKAKPAGLEFSHAYFPDEDHTSTTMIGMRKGLLSVYESWKPPASINSLDKLVSYYRNLSKHYGYNVDITAKQASDIGFNLTRSGDPKAALEVFEYSLANISQDAIAHYQVGYALRKLGRLTEALVEFEKAIELGSGTDFFSVFVRNKDEVAQEINQQSANR